MAFLGIHLPVEIGHLCSNIKIPGAKESLSELHITILPFDRNWAVKDLYKSIQPMLNVTCKTDPFCVRLKRILCFTKSDDKHLLVLSAQSESLHKLHVNFKHEFEKLNIPFHNNFEKYNPHITLSTSSSKINEFDISETIKFTVHEIVLWAGDYGDNRVFIKFPLGSSTYQKDIVSLQCIEIQNKIKQNSSQKYFLPSCERRFIK